MGSLSSLRKCTKTKDWTQKSGFAKAWLMHDPPIGSKRQLPGKVESHQAAQGPSRLFWDWHSLAFSYIKNDALTSQTNCEENLKGLVAGLDKDLWNPKIQDMFTFIFLLSLTSPARTPACTAAPIATTSSGLTSAAHKKWTKNPSALLCTTSCSAKLPHSAPRQTMSNLRCTCLSRHNSMCCKAPWQAKTH